MAQLPGKSFHLLDGHDGNSILLHLDGFDATSCRRKLLGAITGSTAHVARAKLGEARYTITITTNNNH